jgi:Uma2 family endonuclease
MALTVGDREVRPLTADEVLRMVDAGILGEDERVELLHGVLTAVIPQSETHVAVLQRLQRWLAPLIVAGRHDVRVQMPLRVPDVRSLPEPDLAVVRRDDASLAHPASAVLVVEVALSSRRTDVEVKPSLYAAAGVPEYWVVDVPERRVERFTGPGPAAYATRATLAARGALAPLALEAAPVDLDALLSGL